MLASATATGIGIAAAFVEQKLVDEEAAKRVTGDVPAFDTPIRMVGDAAFETLDWHNDLIEEAVVSVVTYNPRNTDDPKDIEYRVEDCIDEHNEGLHLQKSMLETRTTAGHRSNGQLVPVRNAVSRRRASDAASA